jgi:hypothetical protein
MSKKITTSTASVRRRVGAAQPKWTGHIDIAGFGRDERGNRYVGLLIKKKTGAGRVFIPIDEFDRETFKRLNRLGAHIVTDTARRELLARVQSTNRTGKLVSVATRLGRHGPCFVLPRRIYKPSSGTGIKLVRAIDPNVEFNTRFRVAGSAKGWKKLMRIIRRNSRMLLGLGVMLVGPLALVGAFERAAIQLVGDPGSAKTAIGAVASTIWGYNLDPTLAAEYGFGDTWSHTPNELEELLASASHTALFLDETRLVITNPGAWLETVMRIAAGKTKGRMNQKHEDTWYVGVLSTSNLSVAALAALAKQQADRALFDRLIDVPPPEGRHGMFDDLCGFASISALVAHFKAIVAKNHGWIARRFVRALVEKCAVDSEWVSRFLQHRIDFYVSCTRPDQSQFDPQFQRLRRKFGTVYAALCLAAELEVLPLDRTTVRHALLACEHDHISFVAREQHRLRADPLASLRDYCQRHRDRFVEISKVSGNIGSLPGIIAREQGQDRILIPSATFDRICGGTAAGKLVKQQLAKQGLIKTTGTAFHQRFALKRMIAGKRTLVINLSADLMG